MSHYPYDSQPQQPSPEQYYQSPGIQLNTSPALAGARATTAGRQLLVWLLDDIILGLPVVILSFISFLPLIFKIVEVARLRAKYHIRGTLSHAQWTELFGTLAMALIVSSILLLIYYFIYWWLIATKGTTPGMSIMGLRLVSLETGQPIGWGLAFLRGLIVVFSSQLTGGIAGLLFWLSPLFDSTSGWAQSWQDKVVKAVVIDTKNGRDPLVP